MSAGEFYLLKQYLCRFFQDTRIKVSLFLQNGIQGMDGTLAIRYDGFTASGGKPPGTITYFDDDGHVDEEEKFSIASSSGSVEAPASHILEREQMNAHLGLNMYEADSKIGATGFKSTKQAIADAKRGGAKGGPPTLPQKMFKATAEDGLNLLAELLGSSAKDTDSDAKALKLNLFPDDRSSKDGDDDDDKVVPTIWIDAASDRKNPSTLLQDFDVTESKGDHKGDAGDDLLDLMDSTSA